MKSQTFPVARFLTAILLLTGWAGLENGADAQRFFFRPTGVVSYPTPANESSVLVCKDGSCSRMPVARAAARVVTAPVRWVQNGVAARYQVVPTASPVASSSSYGGTVSYAAPASSGSYGGTVSYSPATTTVAAPATTTTSATECQCGPDCPCRANTFQSFQDGSLLKELIGKMEDPRWTPSATDKPELVAAYRFVKALLNDDGAFSDFSSSQGEAAQEIPFFKARTPKAEVDQSSQTNNPTGLSWAKALEWQAQPTSAIAMR